VIIKVSRNGKITIPAVLRKALGVEIGDKVNLIVEKDGIKIMPLKQQAGAKELAGVFSKYAKDKPSLTEEEIEKATEKEFVEGFKNEE
jgi:AbrB family looped-hinge helix DNA binding protein